MTVGLHPDTVEAAQERGGGPAEDRPEGVDDTLNRPELGRGEGNPLVADTYRTYPDAPEQLANPKWGTLVQDLLAHPLVGGYEDGVAELTGANDTSSRKRWRDALEDAADTFGLKAGELFDQGREDREGGREDRLTALLGYEPPADVVGADNPVLVGELYLAGLSVAEVCEVLGDHCEGVREGQVRDALRTVGFLEGATRDEQRDTFEDNDGRLGGVSVSTEDNPGVDVDDEAVATDPNISVQ